MNPEERHFKHSGKLGDIVYSLPAIRAMGGGVLHLSENPSLGFGPAQIQAILPLLNAQPYVRGIKLWSGKAVDHDLDRFRERGGIRENLGCAFLTLFGLPASESDQAWLTLPGTAEPGPVVFARSSLHHGVRGFWNAALDRFGSEAVFIGTKEEHEAFVTEFGEIPYRPTRDLLELAQVIRAARLLAGNQSCPYAIAEGLKVPTIQECDSWSPNCVFHRPNAFYVSNERHLEELASGGELGGKAEEVALAARPNVQFGPHAGELGQETLTGASVVIVTYNSIRTLGRCLQSVMASLSDQDELLIVDNASKDGTANYLKSIEMRPNFRVILNDANRGFSAANNQAILQSRGRFIVLQNPDTEVQPGWLIALSSRFQDGNIGAAGPVANNGFGYQFVRFHLPEDYYGPSDPRELSEAISARHPGRSLETKLLIGFCLMIPRQVLDRVGLLNESMFLGSEDLEISWRLRELGYRLLIARDVLVAHECGGSFSSKSSAEKEQLLQQSSEALVKIIQDAYAPARPPTSTEIWDADIVPDSLMLMGLESDSMKKKGKQKKASGKSPAPVAQPTEAAFQKESAPAAPEPGFHERWSDPDSLLALEALGHKVKELKGAVLDLGVWEGASTFAIANAVHPEHVYAVDTWAGNLDESPVHETVRLAKLRDVKATFDLNAQEFTQGNVEAVQMDCHEFLAGFEGPIKLCHIDASHDYESVKRAILAARPKIVPGGALCGDDFMSAHMGRTDLDGGVERAVRECLPGFFSRGNFWYWIQP